MKLKKNIPEITEIDDDVLIELLKTTHSERYDIIDTHGDNLNSTMLTQLRNQIKNKKHQPETYQYWLINARSNRILRRADHVYQLLSQKYWQRCFNDLTDLSLLETIQSFKTDNHERK